MAKHKVGDLIRYAIIHAIEEREEYLRSIKEVRDEEYDRIRTETRGLINEMKAYFIRRFGFDYWKQEKEYFDSMKTIRLEDIRNL